MPRFFIEPFDGETACLAGEDAAHISRSLRLRPGEAVTLCDGAGTDYDGELLAVGETVTVKTTGPIDGRSSFTGELLGFEDGCVIVAADGADTFRIPYDNIKKARVKGTIDFSA